MTVTGSSDVGAPGRLAEELALCREAIADARAILIAAPATADETGQAAPTRDASRSSADLARLAQDLEAVSDRLSRAERFAEAADREGLKSRADDGLRTPQPPTVEPSGATRVSLIQSPEPQPVRETMPGIEGPMAKPVTPRGRSLKSRLKRTLRKLGRKPAPRVGDRPVTDEEAIEAIERSGLFDAQWYLSKYTDVRDAGVEPLEHFLRHGGNEGRNPGPHFNTRWYVSQSVDIQQSGLNPLVHYATWGQANGLRPTSAEPRPEDNPDVVLLMGSSLFEADWYRARHPGLPKGRHNVAIHYLERGWLAGADPGPDFDGRRYLDQNRDVQAAAVNPLVHYLRHGREEGRQIFSSSATEAAQSARPAAQARNADDRGLSDAELDTWPWTKLDELNLEETRLDALRIGTLTIGYNAHAPRAVLEDVVATFEHLARPAGEAAPERQRFSSTRTPMVADAWFVTSTVLRVRLVLSGPVASVLRCYQAAPGAPQVRLIGEKAVETAGVPLLDVELDNAYAPLLVTLDDGNGLVSAACIIAFPSLARNGDHHAELAATAQGAVPGSVFTYGALLAQEWLGGPASNDLSLGELEIDFEGVMGGERILAPPFLTWARAAMGLAVTPRATPVIADVPTNALRDQLALINERTPLSPRRSKGMILILPGDGLPTLRALVSRKIEPSADGSAAFVVADVIRGKPRWSVTPPQRGPNLSQLQPVSRNGGWPTVSGKGQTPSRSQGESFPLAIRYQETMAVDEEATLLFPLASDARSHVLKQALSPRLTKEACVSAIVTVDCLVDTNTVLTTLTSILNQRGSLVKTVTLVLSDASPELETRARELTTELTIQVAGGSLAAKLNRAAVAATGAYLLTIEAGVVLHDRRTLETLLTLAASPGVASASCALVQSSGARHGRKLDWFSGGVFPTRIDLLESPRLSFGEPRSPMALPAATYAVACNRMRLALTSRKVWSNLGGLDESAFPERDYDLDLALKGLEASMAHLCTTGVTAVLTVPAAFRESNDCASSAMLSTAAWSRALQRMTLLRNIS